MLLESMTIFKALLADFARKLEILVVLGSHVALEILVTAKWLAALWA
jgi:hypothetical protein